MALSENKRHIIEIITQYDPSGAEAFKKSAEEIQAKQDTLAKTGKQSSIMAGVGLDTRGYDSALGRLNGALKEVGVSGTEVSKVLREKVTLSTNAQNQVVRQSTITWRDLNGKLQETKANFIQTKDGLDLVTTSVRSGASGIRSHGVEMLQLAQRALMVAPIWMAVRTAVQAVTATFTLLMTEMIATDKALTNVKLSLNRNVADINASLTSMTATARSSAKEMGILFSDSLNTLTQLKKSGLSVAEAQSALPAALNLSKGAAISLADAVKILDAAYDTFGDKLGESLTAEEKFNKIADITTSMMNRNNTTVQDTISFYSQLAPLMPSLSNDFEEFAGILGVLTDKSQKGSKMASNMGQLVWKILKESDKISEAFDIPIEKDKQLDVLDFLTKAEKKLKGGGFTAEQSDLMKVLFPSYRQSSGGVMIAKELQTIIQEIDNYRSKVKGLAEENAKIYKQSFEGRIESFKSALTLAGTSPEEAMKFTRSLVDSLPKWATNMYPIVQSYKSIYDYIVAIADKAKKEVIPPSTPSIDTSSNKPREVVLREMQGEVFTRGMEAKYAATNKGVGVTAEGKRIEVTIPNVSIKVEGAKDAKETAIIVGKELAKALRSGLIGEAQIT